jgi:MOSC domain-containing protein YiiM
VGQVGTGVLVSINASRGGVPKLPRHEAVVTTEGVEGDRQRDLRYHGGTDRAVCLYSFDRIRELQQEGHAVSVGLMGENLTVMGLDWRLLTPGTRVQIGDVLLLLTNFAVPCKNLAAYFEDGKIFRVSQKVPPGWSRVYARVERPGTVRIGDSVSIAEGDPLPAPAGGTTRLSVRRSGTLRVAAQLEQAFPYFTPDGERLWVPGFDPQYLHPPTGEQGVGAIFTTDHGGEETLWMVLRFSPAEGVAEYARVTPGSRGGTVAVALHRRDAATTEATITYDLTSTSVAGDQTLAAFSEEAYADMLADWEHKIAAVLRDDSFG